MAVVTVVAAILVLATILVAAIRGTARPFTAVLESVGLEGRARVAGEGSRAILVALVLEASEARATVRLELLASRTGGACVNGVEEVGDM